MTVLLVILDATIVNIALPAVSADLGIDAATQQWIVTAYTLTFGGFLLLGGRIADFWGRKRTYLVGAGGFAVASALGGLAQNEAMLFGARALQGAFGALLAPASLALLTVLFTDAKERAKAFAVYGAIAGGGSAVGLLLGGVLTEYADWRWCFWVNLPVAIARHRRWRSRSSRRARRPATPATTSPAPSWSPWAWPRSSTASPGWPGVAGERRSRAAAATSGWTEPLALLFIVAGLLLVAAFVVLELRTRNPLLPMRIVLDRNRGGAYLTSTLVGAGLIGAFFFLSLYFQQVLGYTPVEAGFASLPTTLGVLISAGAASALVPKVGPKPLMVLGGLLAAGRAVPAVVPRRRHRLLGAGLPRPAAARPRPRLHVRAAVQPGAVGAGAHDAGAASAMLNATQQVGASIGTALLATLSVGRDHRLLHRRGRLRRATRRTRPSGSRRRSTATRRRSPGPPGLLVARRPRLRAADQGHQGGPAGRDASSTPA